MLLALVIFGDKWLISVIALVTIGEKDDPPPNRGKRVRASRSRPLSNDQPGPREGSKMA
jgi:hypothetical protein